MLGLLLSGCGNHENDLFSGSSGAGNFGSGGGGGGGSGGGTPSLIFGGLQSGSIAALINAPATGVLTPVTGEPFFAASGAVLGIASAAGRLYAADSKSGSILQFSISSNGGRLTGLACAPITAPQGPVQMIAAAGKFVVVASNTASAVTSYSIGANGCLTQVSSTTTDPFPNSLALDRTGKFLLVVTTQLGTTTNGAVDVFKFDASTGQITSPGSALGISSLNKFVFAAKNSDSFYVTSNDPINNLFQFSLDTTTGTAKLVQSYAANSEPGFGGFDSSGKLLFLPITGDDQIFIYNVAANGTLTTATSSPVSTNPGGVPGGPGSRPFQAEVDPSGKYLYVAGAGDISAFTFNSAGALTAVAGSPFAAAAGLDSMTITTQP
jgi:6-phosphogluconolactonase (cycloisomerase 2 family)